ncbi:hypothetical protein Q0Z83_037650 [Actinoplanes sichuanensis]|uniref:RNA polymerase sigma factor n=1 Tax=Actinoplanes sichuanensis TaxID=512349 RepID=A0ABW4A4E9_9ACTN|nr:sigma-70 family RNA polymerase sigma factor [Actinoplanes sichuanensis]BEL05574.1 hypothetical protein Q0Z83_037650 [Actinoplanes sichuanensis]
MGATNDGGDSEKPTVDAEQLAWDTVNWEEVELANFRGLPWDELIDRLIRHALPIMRSAMSSGKIFTWCRERNAMIRLSRPDPWLPQDQEDLAFRSVSTAVQHFVKAAREGRGWSPAGGATMSSFFLGLCISAFPNEFRTLLREQKKRHHTELSEDTAIPSVPGPEEAVAAADEMNRLLDGIAPEQRRALLAKANGFSHAEIATQMNLTPRAVEGLIYRGRQQLSAFGEADK